MSFTCVQHASAAGAKVGPSELATGFWTAFELRVGLTDVHKQETLLRSETENATETWLTPSLKEKLANNSSCHSFLCLPSGACPHWNHKIDPSRKYGVPFPSD